MAVWLDGWTIGWLTGWMDEWMDGVQVFVLSVVITECLVHAIFFPCKSSKKKIRGKVMQKKKAEASKIMLQRPLCPTCDLCERLYASFCYNTPVCSYSWMRSQLTARTKIISNLIFMIFALEFV